MEQRICAYCKKSLQMSHTARVYCSDACRARARQARERGEENFVKGAGTHGTQTDMHKKPQVQKRRCHDCGKPTHNYRCAECWRKVRDANGISESELAHAV